MNDEKIISTPYENNIKMVHVALYSSIIIFLINCGLYININMLGTRDPSTLLVIITVLSNLVGGFVIIPMSFAGTLSSAKKLTSTLALMMSVANVAFIIYMINHYK